jgi:hypothetical protein
MGKKTKFALSEPGIMALQQDAGEAALSAQPPME